jgi:peroxiredoxin
MAVQEAARIQVGDRLPAITLPRLGGGETTLSELRGKRRLLFMWGSW